jgi:hypothetical protein
MKLRTVIIGAAAAVSLFVSLPARAQSVQPRTNKDVFESICRSAADSVLRQGCSQGMSRVVVKAAAGERTQFFRPAFIDAATAFSGTVFTDGTSADTIVTFGIEDVQVSYGQSFREGWFGEKRTERTATIAVRCEMQQQSTGKLLYSGIVRRSALDTIAVDDIGRLSASTRHIAYGDLPGPSLWEKLLEPAIVTVSSGIAIYLFFTVRS